MGMSYISVLKKTCVCVCVCVCVFVCVRACVRACVHSLHHCMLPSWSVQVIELLEHFLSQEQQREEEGGVVPTWRGIAMSCMNYVHTAPPLHHHYTTTARVEVFMADSCVFSCVFMSRPLARLNGANCGHCICGGGGGGGIEHLPVCIAGTGSKPAVVLLAQQ